jgi:hypothetical protein
LSDMGGGRVRAVDERGAVSVGNGYYRTTDHFSVVVAKWLQTKLAT